jgi:DNA-binding PadR family transcriptional regulator
MLKEKNLKIARTILSNIAEKSVTAPIWILTTLLEMGAAGVEVFFNPSYYYDPTPVIFDGIERGKTRKKKKIKLKEATIRQSLRRLKKQGFVEKKEGKYALARTGKMLMQYVLRRQKAISAKWDGKFRVVIFDIPEKERKTRNWLRQEFYFLKYQKLQESVFIGKLPLPPDLIKDIKRNKIGNYVNYLMVDKVYKNVIK